MTFEEALNLKYSYPSNFVNEKGVKIIFLVAPKNTLFMQNWLNDFNTEFTDYTAKHYCEDGQYWVYWKALN